MKRYVAVILLFFSFTGIAQKQYNYETFIAKASLFHVQKEYKNAIANFEKAFLIQQPNALYAYKAAGVYALDQNKSEALRYLNLALDEGWTETDALVIDPYFDFLRNNAEAEWQIIIEKAKSKEQQYEKTLKLPDLRKRINIMTIQDQKLRFAKSQTNNTGEIEILNQQINDSDFKNLNEAKEIIKNYGWPKISEIGREGQNNFWLIVQHADQDILFQKLALSKMEKLIGTKEIDLENYAFLYDRVQCNLNYKQLYGTQVNWTQNGKASGFRPIIKEGQVDKRRADFKLLPLKIYALNYGFDYENISIEEAQKKDQKDLNDALFLINEAKQSYESNQFQKVYDYYNDASMILGGMSDLQNYEAALLFAKIYNQNGEEKYRSISLDFLSLLFIRGNLNKIKILNQTEFRSFHAQKRWLDIISAI